jgi:ESX secretion system protein EccD
MSTIAMSDTCRVGVQCDADRFDFVVPADVPVAALIPSIVDHVAVGAVPTPSLGSHGVPADWQLSRIDGSSLSSRRSLRENGIRDGDILWLSRVRSAVASPPADDIIAQIAASLDAAPRWTPTAARIAASIIMLCGTGLVGYALLRSQSHQGERVPAMIAGLLCVSAFIAAVVCGRASRDTVTAPTLGSCACGYAAVAGYLVVPGDAEAPKLMLAGAVAATIAVLAARYTVSGTTVFTAAAAFCFSSAAAACAHVFVAVRVDTTGAMLGAAALVMLALTAPLAMWTGGLQVPRLPTSSGRATPDAVSGGTADNALRTHAIVTGLVCGFSAAAAVGATLGAFGGSARGAVFAAVTALVLALRTGTHVDLVQTAALMAGASACFALVFLWAVDSWAQYGSWISLAAACMAAGGAVLLAAPRSATASPLRRRCVEVAEYVALAAVIPAACWVCGVFGLVRGMA